MKKWLFLWVCLLPIAGVYAKEKATVGAKVDERVELLSIVFRLTGAQEYSSNDAKAYVADIEKWFGPYKQDTLVQYAKKVRSQSGIGYDAVARMAVHLEGKGGKYYLPENTLASLCGDGRWNKENAQQFVRLLNDFYKKTRFDKFFKEHEDWYKQMTDRFNSQIDFNRDWYPAFYGERPEGDYRVILGCSNGGSNYGPSVFSDDGKKTVYAVMGCWGFDADTDLPDFSTAVYAATLIHEFNHSFVNHLMEENDNKARMEEAGKKVIAALKEEMSAQAYPQWSTVFNEAIVRAAVVRYMRDNGSSQQEIDQEIRTQCSRYFLWTGGLDSLLGVYSANRDKYPSLRSFYPRIIEFFDSVGVHIDEMKADYLALCPKVVSISPDLNGRGDVDPSITELKVVFDRPILVNARNAAGLMGIDGLAHPSEGRKDRGEAEEESDHMVYSLKLKPDTEYGFTVIGFASATKEGYRIQPQTVKFKTRKE